MKKNKKEFLFKVKKSKTNSGFILNIFEIIIRSHPLIYYIMRYFIRFTNIFEEDANGVSFLNFRDGVNIIDVGASDGIATKFFAGRLNIKNAICFEPNPSYVKILRKLKVAKMIIKPYALDNKNTYKKIFFPRYKFFSKNLDLTPYTFYDKKTLIEQIDSDFIFKSGLEIVEKKLKLKKTHNIDLKIDFIKIDVNDNGLSVVKSLFKIIKRDKPAMLIETDTDINKISSMLKLNGFDKYFFSETDNKFHKIKKKYPLNTYFLQKKHLN